MWQWLAIDYPTFEYALAATQLVLATIGMGVTLQPRDFVHVLRAPRGLLLVLAAQLALTPPLALLLDAVFRLPPGFALGMVLMAAMPVGAMAGIFVILGRGNAALSLAATGLTTLASLVTTTAVLHLFGDHLLPGDFEMPVGRMLIEFTACLLAPLALAMLLSRLAPRRSQAVGKWCVRGSLVTLTSLIVGSLASGRLQVAAHGWRPPAALALYAVAALLMCVILGAVVRLPRAESFTAGVLNTIRNGNLALLLKASLFPATGVADPVADAVLYAVLFYSGASLVVSGGAVLSRKAKQRGDQRRSGATTAETRSDAAAVGELSAT